MFSRIITIALLFFTPIIAIPLGHSLYEVSKVITVQTGIIVYTASLFFEKRFKISLSKPRAITIPTILLLTIVIMQILSGPTIEQFFGNQYRLQGVLLFTLLLLYMYLSSYTRIQIPQKLPLITLTLIVLGSFLLPHNTSYRAVGTLGEPNALAAALLFLWPYLLIVKNSDTNLKKYNYMLIAIVVYIIFVATHSRSGSIAILSQALTFIMLEKYSQPKKLVLIIPAIILLISIGLPFLEQERIWHDRSEVWITAFHAGTQKPLTGHGIGNITSALDDSAQILRNTIRYQHVDSSHNIFLDWWVQAGIPGIVIFIFLLYNSFKNHIQNNNTPELLALIGILTALSFNPASVSSLIVFWWLLGNSSISIKI